MSILGVISLAVCIWLTRSNQPYAFYLTPLRAWAFAAGGLASQIQPSELRSKTVTLRIAGWLGLAGISMCGFFLSPAGFPGIKAVLPVISTVMVLIAGSVKISGGVGQLLNGRVLQYIGRRSYALYLWRWPLLVFASVLWDPFVIKFRILAIATSFLLAELTHRFVENPIRFSSYLQKRAPLCVAASFVIIVAGTGGAFLWRVWAKHTPNYRSLWNGHGRYSRRHAPELSCSIWSFKAGGLLLWRSQLSHNDCSLWRLSR
jgi:peptidoglycan/LPS O-acetylase OafA/YrhL